MAFDSNFSPPQSSHLVVTQFANDWANANTSIIVKNCCLYSVAWVPPSEGWFKLNIDGSCDSGTGNISAGGVIRNHWKTWVKGFVMNKGGGNVIEAELWGMFEGLTMARNAGIRRIIVETDSLDTVHLISNDINPNHPLFSLIQSCKHMVEAECMVKHVYREGNRLADGLALMGHSMKNEVMYFEDPPPQISGIYEDDRRGLGFVRQCAAPVSLST